MTKPQIIFSVEKDPEHDIFFLKANSKPLKTPKGAEWFCWVEDLAQATLDELKELGTQSPLYRLQSYILDNDATDTFNEICNHFDTDLVFYEADAPVDLVAFQKQHWEPVREWLCEALGGVPFRISHHTTLNEQPKKTHAALKEYLYKTEVEHAAVAYFAGRLAASVCIGLAFAAKQLDAITAHKAAMADEYYQETRYKPDELLTKRLDENKAKFISLQNFRDLSY